MCKLKGYDPNNVIFICQIRHPIDRYISAYYYALKFNNNTRLFIYNDVNNTTADFEKFVYNNIHYKHFYSDEFRIYEHYKIHTVNVENLKTNFEKILQSNDIDLNCSCMNNIKNETTRDNIINLSVKIINYITDKFKLDYVDGGYNNDFYLSKLDFTN